MRYRPEQKTEVSAKIVKDAARRVRTEGLTGAAVSTEMQDAGLTHGGFYKHFESKDQLLLESPRVHERRLSRNRGASHRSRNQGASRNRLEGDHQRLSQSGALRSSRDRLPPWSPWPRS